MERIATSASAPTSANCSVSEPTPVTAELRKSSTDTTTNNGSGLTGSLADTNANYAAPVSNTILRRSERVAKRKRVNAERGRQVEEATQSRKRKRDEEEVGDIISMGDVVEPVEKENVEEDIHASTKTSVRAKRARKTPYKQASMTTEGWEGPGTASSVVASTKTQTCRKKKNASAGSKAKRLAKGASLTQESTRATRSNLAETNREQQMPSVDASRGTHRDDTDSACTVEDLQNTDHCYSRFQEPLRVDAAPSAPSHAHVAHRPVDCSADTARFHQPTAFPPDDIRSTLAHEDHIERVAVELLLLRHRCIARVPR